MRADRVTGEYRKPRLLGFLLSLLAVAPVILSLKLLNTSRGVNEAHLAREERMAGRTNFDRDVLAGAARGEFIATTTKDRGLFVFGVNTFLHSLCSWRDAHSLIVQ